jgi:arginine exporter protein ArgO
VTGALVAGLLAGYGVAVPVGAIGALIVGLTARTSLRVGAAAALGVATADGVFAVVAVLGGAAIGRLIEPVATPLRWAAAAAQIVFVAAAFAASASWQLLLAGGGSLVGRTLTGTRGRLATAMVSSAFIVVLAVALVLPWH